MKISLLVLLLTVILTASELITVDAAEARSRVVRSDVDSYSAAHVRARAPRYTSTRYEGVTEKTTEEKVENVEQTKEEKVITKVEEEKSNYSEPTVKKNEPEVQEFVKNEPEVQEFVKNEPEVKEVVKVDVPETEVEVVSESNSFLDKVATEIHRLTNLERAKVGESALVFSSDIADLAQSHSEDMAKRNYFSHDTPEGCDGGCRLDKANYDYVAWGENIAWRSSSNLPDAEELADLFMEMWMDSSGHRRNILSDNYTHEGIGLYQIGNKVYVTTKFADPE